MSKIKTVGIVGTGVIGTGWIIRNLAHNKIVHAYDQNKNLKNYVLKEIKRTSKSIKKLFGKKILIKNLKFFNLFIFSERKYSHPVRIIIIKS